MTENQRQTVEDPGVDILSHGRRKNIIHILTVDPTLAEDVYERIHTDKRMKNFKIIRPAGTNVKNRLEQIEAMASDTTSSRLIIFDVRKSTLPMLRQPFNKIVGYNRRDLNRFCYNLLIGDGPMNLFHSGKCFDPFVPYLAKHRTDYYPAAFFYDPFLHYEPDEMPRTPGDYESLLPKELPNRLAYFFKEQTITVADIRRYFRAAAKPKSKPKRTKTLIDMYKKRLKKQFADQNCNLDNLFTKEGLQLATERLNLYPLYFEDWAFELIEKTRKAS